MLQVTPLYIQQYGYNYTVTLEPANDTIPVNTLMTTSHFFNSHVYYTLQKFTTIDALLLEEYLFNDVIELFDMTHGIYLYPLDISSLSYTCILL